MVLNITSIKKSVEKAISTSPTNINLMRENRIDDGYGGYYLDTKNPHIIIFNNDIYLNEVSATKNDTLITEGGRVDKINGVSAIIPIGNYEIKEGDFFIKDDKKYTVKFATNIYQAYWSVDWEVSNNVIK